MCTINSSAHLFFAFFSLLIIPYNHIPRLLLLQEREAKRKCCSRNTGQAVLLSYVITCCYKPDCPEKSITASLTSSKAPSSIFLTHTILLPRHFMQDMPDLQK